MKTSGVINNAFVQYRVQRFVYCECRRVNVAIATSLLSFVCDALELCLLHSSLPSLLCTPPSLPAKLPSVSTTLYFLFLQQWQQQCRQPDCPPIHTPTHPPFCQPAYQRAGRPVSGPVPDGLGQQCVLGLHPLKRGAFHRRGLLFDEAAVWF